MIDEHDGGVLGGETIRARHRSSSAGGRTEPHPLAFAEAGAGEKLLFSGAVGQKPWASRRLRAKSKKARVRVGSSRLGVRK